ncbi:hypothetical protein OY671_009005, partial [Metschnikowia pulcherrima]
RAGSGLRQVFVRCRQRHRRAQRQHHDGGAPSDSEDTQAHRQCPQFQAPVPKSAGRGAFPVDGAQGVRGVPARLRPAWVRKIHPQCLAGHGAGRDRPPAWPQADRAGPWNAAGNHRAQHGQPRQRRLLRQGGQRPARVRARCRDRPARARTRDAVQRPRPARRSGDSWHGSASARRFPARCDARQGDRPSGQFPPVPLDGAAGRAAPVVQRLQFVVLSPAQRRNGRDSDRGAADR